MNQFGRAFAALATAILVCCSQAWAQEPDQPNDQNQPSEKKEQILEFEIEGYEFRNYASYPEDNTGEGFEQNAWLSYLAKCQATQEEAANALGEDFVAFDCNMNNAVEVLEQSGKALFRSTAKLTLQSAALSKVMPDVRVEGPRVLAADYESHGELKWQESRHVARVGYEEACVQFKAAIAEQYGDILLFVSCGTLLDDGGKTGWKFYSQPVVFLNAEGPSTGGNCDNRPNGSSWWEVDEEEVIRETVSCGTGRSRTDIFAQENQYRCQDGEVVATGEIRRGDYLDSEGGSCEPRSCGDKLHGDTWFDNAPGTVERRVLCPAGGSKIEVYRRVVKKTCFDGTVITGNEFPGEYIQTIGSCPSRIHCSNGSRHGERWWSIDWGNPVYRRQWCPEGGRVTHVYARETLMLCDYGSIVYTGLSRAAYLIDSYGRCRQRPDRPHPRPMRPKPRRPEPRPMRPEPRPMRPEPRPMRPEPRPMRPEPRPMRPEPRPMRPEPRPMRPEPRPMRPEPRPMRPEPRPMRPEPRPMRPEPMRPEPRPMRPQPMRPEPRPMRPEPMRPEPRPMRPEPMRPEPRPMRPEPMRPEPRPMRPEPMRPEPRPMRPEPMRPEPRPMRPEPMRPERPRPQPMRPERPRPQPMRPERPRPQPMRPERPRPQPMRPERPRPQPMRPERPRPQPMRPERPRPQPMRPERPRPQPMRPERPRPQPMRPERPRPQPMRPERPRPMRPGGMRPRRANLMEEGSVKTEAKESKETKDSGLEFEMPSPGDLQ